MQNIRGNIINGLEPVSNSFSAKQHYLNQSRYVTGQTTKLPLQNSNLPYSLATGGKRNI